MILENSGVFGIHGDTLEFEKYFIFQAILLSFGDLWDWVTLKILCRLGFRRIFSQTCYSHVFK